ncbi:hypothetical protein C8Q77DRAFT_1061631 [Trametes polyzona]|nr:hypothetical protein C8Q77DRAFT_1061631 [Trametes polyzona]
MAPDLPSGSFMKLVAGIPRRHAAVLFQLRAGHAPLGEHLHRIGCANTPACAACGEASESVFHYLIACRGHAEARATHLASLGANGRKIDFLLNSDKAIKPLFAFINATGRLHGTFGALTLRQRQPCLDPMASRRRVERDGTGR